MVLKPATQTPYSALALAELRAQRAGIPAGVFNVLTGSSTAIGGEMTANPTVRKLTFTGSTEVGKKLMNQCAGTLKKLSLELGGNAPVYRIRGRQTRCRSRGRHREQIPQHGPNLRMRESIVGARPCICHLRRQVGSSRGQAQGWRWASRSY